MSLILILFINLSVLKFYSLISTSWWLIMCLPLISLIVFLALALVGSAKEMKLLNAEYQKNVKEFEERHCKK